MNIINEQIRAFGEGLKNRIPPSIIDFDLEYIGYSESILAFETLCDHIADYDVLITKDEYNMVIDIATKLCLEINGRYSYINPEK